MTRRDTLRSDPDGWEADADAFYRATGYMRPGKDDARGCHTDEDRREAWVRWLDQEVMP